VNEGKLVEGGFRSLERYQRALALPMTFACWQNLGKILSRLITRRHGKALLNECLLELLNERPVRDRRCFCLMGAQTLEGSYTMSHRARF